MSGTRNRSKRKQDISTRNADPDPKVLKQKSEGFQRSTTGVAKKASKPALKKETSRVAGQQSVKAFLSSSSSVPSTSKTTNSDLVEDSDLRLQATTVETCCVEEIDEPMEMGSNSLPSDIRQRPEVIQDPAFNIPV